MLYLHPLFYYKKLPEAGVAAWYQRLFDAAVPAGGRVLLYHIPQTTVSRPAEV